MCNIARQELCRTHDDADPLFTKEREIAVVSDNLHASLL